MTAWMRPARPAQRARRCCTTMLGTRCAAPRSCGARTDAVAQLEQLAQRSQRCDASIPTCRGCARVLGLVAWAAGPRVSYCIRVGQDLHPPPVPCTVGRSMCIGVSVVRASKRSIRRVARYIRYIEQRQLVRYPRHTQNDVPRANGRGTCRTAHAAHNPQAMDSPSGA